MALRNILTLDLATNVGWAVGPPDGDPISGTEKLPSTGADIGRFACKFEDWLLDMLILHDPALVVFEAPFVGKTGNANTARKLMGLCWQTEVCCYRREIRCAEHNNASVKKFFAGHGRAEKEDMIAAARRQGWNPVDDNAADALGLWACVVNERAPQFAARFQLGPLAHKVSA